ncbi:sigma-70 family RNA polymerase sigma factor [Pontibacter sp. G13]|uniref:RNA polymerase sigma factor n=1 Tax=Pontibacter sp. G13 TaxID=3074898 RepID=UPI00288A82F3|nr:sigma-70 family RNA polymerase sigma factor [Pontibacter sp. G13]WNJ19321.1 sigma-70 family RNA polymerase sigma factor [Pontibacter sp. G13]
MIALKETHLLAELRDPATKVAAFDRLIKGYQEVLYHHIRRIVINHDDTDDVLQNTLIKAWQNLDKFRGDANIKTWIYRIATNEALNFLKKKKRQAFQEVEDLQNDLRHSLSSGRYVDGDEIQIRLQEAIIALPERQKLVFNLRYFDEMPYDEISSILGVTVGALKASYHHAVKKVEHHLKRYA